MSLIRFPQAVILLAQELATHLLHGAWAHDDVVLLGLARSAELDRGPWPLDLTPGQAAFVHALIAKAADSDWSWEVHALTGKAPGEFQKALRMMAERTGVIAGMSESEVAFDHLSEMSPYDPRAEALARQRGMSEDEIAMIKAGLEDAKAGKTKPSSEVFARLSAKYGW